MIQQFHSWVYIQIKTLIQKDFTCTPMFTAALFTIAKAWEKLKSPSTDEWINKMEGVCVCVCVCVCVYNEKLLSHKKE